MTAARGDRVQWRHAAAVAVVLFAVYAATAPRTVALEDDGGFILSSHFLGVEHPPGFPVHTLLGKLFTLLPIGSIAYRVHLLSAAFGALTCAAVWLCARRLTGATVPAYLAALGLGLSPAFWSQSIIAEVYTLNTFFLFALVLLALRGTGNDPPGWRMLPAFALLFGLSLANHWPLVLLAAPGLAVLLLPRTVEILRRLPLLVAFFLAGLAPYAWMVVRSWSDPVISFYGPLESAREVWVMVSRAGYAGTDVSATAGAADRIAFFGFLGREALTQFAVAGTALGAYGFVAQWRVWGTRVAAGLTIVCAMPSVVLLLLIGFDYDVLYRSVFRVYPLPAYGVLALWLGLGFAELARRLSTGLAARAVACAGLVALIAVNGAAANLRSGYDWSVRYARAVLESLPRDTVLFVHGDIELGTIAYLNIVEGVRPDVALVNPRGLVLGSRLLHPLRTTAEGMQGAVRYFAENSARPVAFTGLVPAGLARQDRWLYSLATPDAAGDAPPFALDEALQRFLEESVLAGDETDTWTIVYRDRMRRRIGALLASGVAAGRPADARTARQLAGLAQTWAGALGLAEGLLAAGGGAGLERVADLLAVAESLMPKDASKAERALLYELRAYARLARDDKGGAIADLERSIAAFPSPGNRAFRALADLQPATGATRPEAPR